MAKVRHKTAIFEHDWLVALAPRKPEVGVVRNFLRV